VRHFKFAEEVSGNSLVDLDNIIDWWLSNPPDGGGYW
jgi:hypothetical protein